MPAQSKASAGFLSCAAAALLWGLGFFFGKIALLEVSVPHMVLWRFLFASVAMVPFLPRHFPRFSRNEWSQLALGSLFGIPVQFLLQFYGLAHTTLAHAALMVGTMPVILAVGASLFLGESLDGTGWMALGGSCAGAILIALSHSTSNAGAASLFGDGLVLLSLCLALVWIVTNRWLMEHHAPATVSSYGLLLGTAMLALIVTAYAGPPPVRRISLHAWLALAASGVLCTAATTLLWNWGMRQVPASAAGVFLNLEPIMGSGLSMWLFHERLGWTAALGGSLIVGCAVLMTARHQGATAVPVGVLE